MATEQLAAADPLRLAVLAAMAFARAHTGDMEDVIALAEQVLEQRTRTLGPDHADTLTSRYNYATWLRTVDPTKWAALLSELLADGTRALGPVHPEVLLIRNEHAITLMETGQPARTRDLLSDLVHDITEVRGPRHPTTLIIRSNHAAAVHAAGDPLLACELSAQLIADHIEILGPTHRRTLQERWGYARCVADGGDPARAFALLEELSRSDGSFLMDAVSVLADAVDIDPASARSYLAEVLGRPAKEALVVIVAIAVSPELKGRLDCWLIEVLRDLGLASMLCPSLLTAVMSAPAFGESSQAILRRWLALSAPK